MLKFDYDGAVKWKRIRTVIGMFGLNIDFSWSRWAKTRHGFHVYLAVKNKLRPIDEIFLQLACGSDFKRECLNFMRIKNNAHSGTFNVLFSKKYRVDLDGRAVLSSQEKALSKGVLVKRLAMA